MKSNKYHDLINSVKFQVIAGEDFKNMLIEYAELYIIDNQFKLSPGISASDFNNIYRLQTFKNEYVKNEALKILSHKTIIQIFN